MIERAFYPLTLALLCLMVAVTVACTERKTLITPDGYTLEEFHSDNPEYDYEATQ